MRTDDYLADYAQLGLQPGCSVETLERRWRLAVRELHPDRAGNRADAEVQAARLHGLTAAYRRLRQFEREHGRLPGAAPVPAPAAAQEGPSLPPSLEAKAAGGARWPWVAVPMLALALVVLGLGREEEPALAIDPEPAPAAATVLDASAAPATQRAPRIRVGSTEAYVERMLGTPPVSEAGLWEYGPSHIRFERGRVVGWYSSPLKPLPVDVERR